MNKDKYKLDFSSKDWIRCQSKSHTGRFYMFNKATGETRWCSRDTDAASKPRTEGSSPKSREKKESPPKVITAKLIKTPAQDRLKRLQGNLHKDRELKERNVEKSPKRSRVKSSHSKDGKDANKLKNAFMPERDKSILPCRTTSSSTSSSKLSRARTSSKTSAMAMPSTSRTSATASSSKTMATASSSKKAASSTTPKRQASPASLRTSSGFTPSSPRTSPISTASKDSDLEEAETLRETIPRFSFYGRRLRLSSDSTGYENSEKQNSYKFNADKTAAHRRSSSDRSPHRRSSTDRSPHDSSDRRSTEKSASSKSASPTEAERNLNLKRRAMKKSPKRMAKKRRLSMHKTPHFNPTKEVTSTTADNLAEESSSDDAITSSDASLNPTRRIGFIDKIKAICKNTFRMTSTMPTAVHSSSTLKVVKSPPTLGIHSSLSSIQTYKASESNENGNKDELMPPEQNDSSMLLPTIKTSSLAPLMLPPPLPPPPSSPLPILSASSSKECNATTNNQIVPAYPRGSANTRLERLRQSLFMQPLLPSKNRLPENSSPNTSNTELLDKFQNNCYNNNSNNKNNNSNTYEPMDWQAIDDFPCSTSLATLENARTSPTVETKAVSFADKNDCGNVSEYYDSVNANLMRFSSEQQDRLKWSSQKWLPDHYYFVIDTNVLLNCLTFVDDLIHMRLCDTKGTIVYIPYCVLQELDKLKMRSSSEATKSLTNRAIKYLNKKFEECNKNIHAQSAIDERNHLIDVISPDDSILNCCMHVKRHVENVVLLTEDVNLRNKAICNNLLVTTKSDLISKHPEPTTPSNSIWHELEAEDSRQ